jgi:signal peptidase I
MSRTRRQFIAVLVFLLVAGFFMTRFRLAVVHGESMMPTYRDGELVLVNKLGSEATNLQRGDVVLVRNGKDILIKRVVFLPGDILRGHDALAFRRVWQYFEQVPDPSSPIGGMSLRVPQGTIVVLGDNPAVSDDSRLFGPVPIEDVIGRVVNPRPPL